MKQKSIPHYKDYLLACTRILCSTSLKLLIFVLILFLYSCNQLAYASYLIILSFDWLEDAIPLFFFNSYDHLYLNPSPPPPECFFFLKGGQWGEGRRHSRLRVLRRDQARPPANDRLPGGRTGERRAGVPQEENQGQGNNSSTKTSTNNNG